MEFNVKMCDDCLQSVSAYDVLDCVDTKLDSMRVVIGLVSRLIMELDKIGSDQTFNRKTEEISLLLDGLMDFHIPMIRGMVQTVMKTVEPTE